MRASSPAVLVLALLVLAPASAPAAPRTIEPGWWEATNRVLSPLRSSKTERRCIRPADVAKFMEGPGNHIYRCTYPTKVFRNGRIQLKGSCKSRDRPPFPITGEGTYDADQFHLDARATAMLGPVHLPIRAVTDARRIGDVCPAPQTPETEAGNASGGSEGATQ
jgi:hypothetical protein